MIGMCCCRYKVIGLCMSLEGAFDDLLDKSSFCVAFMDLETMEFRYLSKLIDDVFLLLIRIVLLNYGKNGCWTSCDLCLDTMRVYFMLLGLVLCIRIELKFLITLANLLNQ